MKAFKLFILAIFITIFLPVVHKALPIVRDKECNRSFFPAAKFLSKLKQPSPAWMIRQIESDLQLVNEQKITLKAINETFSKIGRTIEIPFDRYRIFENQLYKYKPQGRRISGRDNAFEKALKTLLLYAKVPNVDFIYCPMDGIPESYVPSDFYFTESQAPIFAKAKLKSAPFIILIPDQFSLSEDWFFTSHEILELNEEMKWEAKKELAMWRGGLTDVGVPNGQNMKTFRECPRYKICKMSAEMPGLVDAGLQWSDNENLDQILLEEKVMKNGSSKKEHLLFKYLPVLDGHMCTYPGFQWRLLSNSVCLKQESDQVQWFYSALKPFVHYVPVQNDMSDLILKIEWAKAHEERVKEIVQNAQEFAKNHLLPEDDYYYLYLAFSEYAKHQRINWKEAEKELDTNQWKCIQYRKRHDLQKTWRKVVNQFLR